MADRVHPGSLAGATGTYRDFSSARVSFHEGPRMRRSPMTPTQRQFCKDFIVAVLAALAALYLYAVLT